VIPYKYLLLSIFYYAMNISHIIKTALTSTIAFLLVVSVASAQWNPPTAGPPNANTPAPIHVGSDTQAKDGGLTIFSNSWTGSLWDGIISTGWGWFNHAVAYQSFTAPKLCLGQFAAPDFINQDDAADDFELGTVWNPDPADCITWETGWRNLPDGGENGDILIWDGGEWLPGDQFELPEGTETGQILRWSNGSWLPVTPAPEAPTVEVGDGNGPLSSTDIPFLSLFFTDGLQVQENAPNVFEITANGGGSLDVYLDDDGDTWLTDTDDPIEFIFGNNLNVTEGSPNEIFINDYDLNFFNQGSGLPLNSAGNLDITFGEGLTATSQGVNDLLIEGGIPDGGNQWNILYWNPDEDEWMLADNTFYRPDAGAGLTINYNQDEKLTFIDSNGDCPEFGTLFLSQHPEAGSWRQITCNDDLRIRNTSNGQTQEDWVDISPGQGDGFININGNIVINPQGNGLAGANPVCPGGVFEQCDPQTPDQPRYVLTHDDHGWSSYDSYLSFITEFDDGNDEYAVSSFASAVRIEDIPVPREEDEPLIRNLCYNTETRVLVDCDLLTGAEVVTPPTDIEEPNPEQCFDVPYGAETLFINACAAGGGGGGGGHAFPLIYLALGQTVGDDLERGGGGGGAGGYGECVFEYSYTIPQGGVDEEGVAGEVCAFVGRGGDPGDRGWRSRQNGIVQESTNGSYGQNTSVRFRAGGSSTWTNLLELDGGQGGRRGLSSSEAQHPCFGGQGGEVGSPGGDNYWAHGRHGTGNQDNVTCLEGGQTLDEAASEYGGGLQFSYETIGYSYGGRGGVSAFYLNEVLQNTEGAIGSVGDFITMSTFEPIDGVGVLYTACTENAEGGDEYSNFGDHGCSPTVPGAGGGGGAGAYGGEWGHSGSAQSKGGNGGRGANGAVKVWWE
jgi:hypothetical protein